MVSQYKIKVRRNKLKKLFFTKYHTQEELVKALGVSRRTIVRDMKAIENDIEKEFNKRERKWKKEYEAIRKKEDEMLDSMLEQDHKVRAFKNLLSH